MSEWHQCCWIISASCKKYVLYSPLLKHWRLKYKPRGHTCLFSLIPAHNIQQVTSPVFRAAKCCVCISTYALEFWRCGSISQPITTQHLRHVAIQDCFAACWHMFMMLSESDHMLLIGWLFLWHMKIISFIISIHSVPTYNKKVVDKSNTTEWITSGG